ncbi:MULTISPECIES: efflux RND transporter periplasmic adaptor subunit [Hyphomicrobium]|uniref:efflux RND transporter periplasmic adaptor subunit n=1 Tax=Hyphomicrobium TaxID=81 RepID=UPI0003AA06FC|nr:MULTISPECIES: efflux RND transporter periplasmic adaptor subunit [Hyphomicrobium]WBT36232.1 efflux RND transporter periplasmic adaptor subunit [Hyphomicrobium sp. DMF-1]HML41398.1 efflux RND transporter periplasmic adaptor subunit [Hyphomicrobium zavarzinii]
MLRHIMAWTVVILAVAGIAGGLGFYKYSEIKTAIAAGEATPEPVESVLSTRSREGQWSAVTRAIGTVVALRQLEVKNEIAGAISEIGFTSGAIVEKGDLLVQFDTRQEQAALAAAEADARLAKLTLDRRESLRGSAAFSAQELDRSREEFNAATARARNLEVIVDKKRITAPFRARVGITNWQPGAYLDAGTLIVTLQGTAADAYVDFSLPQDSAVAIRPGTVVTLSGPAVPGGETTAKIIAEDNSADGSNRSIRFRAAAAGFGEKLRPGTFVDVIVRTSEPRTAVMVPLASVRRSPNGQHVFVLVEENGKLRARQRTVQTGAVQGDDIAIEKGLAAGELIAASGSFKLREGLLVDAGMPAPAPSTDVGVN